MSLVESPVRSASSGIEPLRQEIFALKRKLNAVILAHNYQVAEIQDVADYVGDSLGLSQHAAKTSADVIVFCGVHFMAETAKILNPSKVVLLPDKDAGCSLEESCPADKLAEFQKTNPNFYTIAYINCKGLLCFFGKGFWCFFANEKLSMCHGVINWNTCELGDYWILAALKY